ncbi:hypothetical protein [Rhabdothermincola salaria]|uniref:hypothetical protein n=1 Tax=Rhabdothermincola salaria TaxID=2903142 RepID=UPI001E3551E4|nr:hypothetical protein [Rhabdothermincola salaria]MCD9624952.1 hypothetical protein [Rhabdothermincola salaria]
MTMKVDEFRVELEQGLGDVPLVDEPTWASVVRRGRRLRRVRRAAPVTVLGVLLVAAVGLAALAVGGDQSATVMTSDPPAAPPSTPVAPFATIPQIEGGAEAGLYLLADPPPQGLPLVLRAGPLDEGGESISGDGTARSQRWVLFDDTGRAPEAVFDLQWGASPSFVAEWSSTLEEEGAVAVGDFDGEYLVNLGALVWEEPSVGFVVLSSQQLNATQLVELADQLAVTEEGPSFEEAPAGFELVYDGDSSISLGGAVRRVAYGDGSRGFGLFLAEHSEYQPKMNLYFPEARLVDVRGTEAVLSPRAFVIAGGSLPGPVSYLVNPDWVLQWQEGDTLISATATGLSPDALVDFANTLERVDYATWESTAPS